MQLGLSTMPMPHVFTLWPAKFSIAPFSHDCLYVAPPASHSNSNRKSNINPLQVLAVTVLYIRNSVHIPCCMLFLFAHCRFQVAATAVVVLLAMLATIEATPTAPLPVTTAAHTVSGKRRPITGVDLTQPARAPAAAIKAVTCPTSVGRVIPGSDLAAVTTAAGNGEGKTYQLAPGTYFINSTISLNSNGTVTCYQGTSKDAVTVFVDPAVGVSRATTVEHGAQLGLQKLSIDGQDASAGVSVTSASLEVTGVTMQRFRGVRGGAAVQLTASAAATFEDSTFTDNTCAGCFAGAVGVVDDGADATFSQVWPFC